VPFTLRVVDVNDLIYNTAGAAIGYGLFQLFHRIFRSFIHRRGIKLNAFLRYIYNIGGEKTADTSD